MSCELKKECLNYYKFCKECMRSSSLKHPYPKYEEKTENIMIDLERASIIIAGLMKMAEEQRRECVECLKRQLEEE